MHREYRPCAEFRVASGSGAGPADILRPPTTRRRRSPCLDRAPGSWLRTRRLLLGRFDVGGVHRRPAGRDSLQPVPRPLHPGPHRDRHELTDGARAQNLRPQARRLRRLDARRRLDRAVHDHATGPGRARGGADRRRVLAGSRCADPPAAGARPGLGGRGPARRARGGPARHDLGHTGLGGRAGRRVVPELLARDHADPPLLRGRPPAAALGAQRVRARGRPDRPRAPRDPAHPDPGPDPDGVAHALHALEPARGAAPGLRPDRARQGARRWTRRLAPRAPQRAHPGRDGGRPVDADSGRRRGPHRDCLRVAGYRSPRRGRRLRARLPGDHGRQPDGRRGRDRREPDHRSRLLRDRSADLVPVTAEARAERPSALRRFARNRRGLVGGVVVAVMVAAGALAPVLAPESYSAQSLLNRLKPPSAAHWLGTDGFGRDVLSRVIWGSRVSLEIGLAATALALVMGTAVGSVAGYFGGGVDTAIMRAADVFLSVPALFLILIVVALFDASLANTALVIALVTWAPVGRIVRGECLSLRHRDFVHAA